MFCLSIQNQNSNERNVHGPYTHTHTLLLSICVVFTYLKLHWYDECNEDADKITSIKVVLFCTQRYRGKHLI